MNTMTDPKDTLPRKGLLSHLRAIFSVIALLVFGLIWAYFLTGQMRSYKVISRSMAPTLEVGDYVLMVRDESTRDLRGNIIAFDNPTKPGDALTKRVVAAEGDTVVLRDGSIYVNDKPEAHNVGKIVNVSDYKWEIHADELFVMGDNRNESYDSIDTGPISRSLVKGVIVYRYWPSSRAGALH